LHHGGKLVRDDLFYPSVSAAHGRGAGRRESFVGFTRPVTVSDVSLDTNPPNGHFGFISPEQWAASTGVILMALNFLLSADDLIEEMFDCPSRVLFTFPVIRL
jgi:hypothetical protein